MRSTNLAKTAQNDWREAKRPQVAMHSHTIATFSMLSILALNGRKEIADQIYDIGSVVCETSFLPRHLAYPSPFLQGGAIFDTIRF